MRAKLIVAMTAALAASACMVPADEAAAPEAESVGQATARIEPMTVFTVATSVISAVHGYSSGQQMRDQIESIKDAIDQAKRELDRSINNLDARNKVSPALAYLDDFQSVASWSDNDFSIHAWRGQELVRGLMDVVQSSPSEQAEMVIDTLNLLAPAVAIVRVANGFDAKSVDETTLRTLYDTNALYMTTVYPRYLREHESSLRMENPLTRPQFWRMSNGFEARIPLDGALPGGGTFFGIVAPTKDHFRRIESMQVVLAPYLNIPVTPREQLNGYFMATNGWVGRFDGTGGFCGFVSPAHLAAAGQPAVAGVLLSPAYLATPGMRDGGACPGIPATRPPRPRPRPPGTLEP